MDLNDIVDSPARRKVFDTFLEEACRQWCDFIDDAPERATGEGFAGFFYEIFEMKEEEMLEEANAQINACVMATIGGDRAKLPVKTVTSECLKQELEHYGESGARAEEADFQNEAKGVYCWYAPSHYGGKWRFHDCWSGIPGQGREY